MPRKKKIGKVRKRPRRVSGFDLGTDINLVVLGGVGLAGWYVYTKFIKGTGGAAPDTNTVTAQTTATALIAQTAAGDGPNYEPTQYAAWAEAIHSTYKEYFPASATSDETATVLNIMDQLDNLADVYSLIQAFGTVQTGGLIGNSFDLVGFIGNNFTNASIDLFNQQLGYNNVSYSWPY